MSDLLPASLLVTYTVFSLFVFYHQYHLHRFRGSSGGYQLALGLSAFAGRIVGLAFLIYCGVAVVWYLPLILVGVSFALRVIWFAVEAYLDKTLAELTGNRQVPLAVLSPLGFVAWPISAILMVLSLP